MQLTAQHSPVWMSLILQDGDVCGQSSMSGPDSINALTLYSALR